MELLEHVFALCDTKAAGKTCAAIKGILEEGQEDMAEAADAEVLDAGMIADAQAVEHYEIARYGTLVAWANSAGHERGRDTAEPDVRAGIQLRPDIDRACGGKSESAGCSLRLPRFFRLCERRRHDRAVFVSA